MVIVPDPVDDTAWSGDALIAFKPQDYPWIQFARAWAQARRNRHQLHDLGQDDIGFWILELETAWPVVMDVTVRLLAAAVGAAERPTEEEIERLLSEQTLTVSDLSRSAPDVEAWRIGDDQTSQPT